MRAGLIEVYVRKGCPDCEKIVGLVSKNTSSENVLVKDVDEQVAMDELLSLGFLGTPVLKCGDLVFGREKINEALVKRICNHH